LLAVVLMVVGSITIAGTAQANDYLDPGLGVAGASHWAAPVQLLPDGVRFVDSWAMADGRVVVAGETGLDNCDSTRWGVGRYLPDGGFDPTFGGGAGWVQLLPQGVTTPCFTQTTDPLRL